MFYVNRKYPTRILHFIYYFYYHPPLLLCLCCVQFALQPVEISLRPVKQKEKNSVSGNFLSKRSKNSYLYVQIQFVFIHITRSRTSFTS